MSDAPAQRALVVEDDPDIGQLLVHYLQKAGFTPSLLTTGRDVVARARSDQQPVFEVPHDAIEEVLRLNLHGTLIPSLVFGETMGRQRAGCIVNISSMASQRRFSSALASSRSTAPGLTPGPYRNQPSIESGRDARGSSDA